MVAEGPFVYLRRTMPKLLDRFDEFVLDDELRSILARIPNKLNEFGYDPWGMNPKLAVPSAPVSCRRRKSSGLDNTTVAPATGSPAAVSPSAVTVTASSWYPGP